jgi:STE24 endopeptidase
MIPINVFLGAYLGLYLFGTGASLVIDRMNARHLTKYDGIPKGFEGFLDEGELRKMTLYHLDQTRFRLFQTLTEMTLFLFIILSGLLPWLADALSNTNFVLAGLVFFALPGAMGGLVSLPFDYYHSFVLEEKYGFNTKTTAVWVTDLIKSLLLLALLGGFLLSALLSLVRYAGPSWWFWAWGIFFGFQLLMTLLYPAVIAPMFNRFTPLSEPRLAEKIADLARKEGLNIRGIYQMDAARRSKHTNAYFTGLGKTKRVVLFDTLISSHEEDEILAVLAHEIGHLKRGHIRKQILLMGLGTFLLFYLASLMIRWPLLYESFGFIGTPVYAGLFLAGVLWDPFGFFLAPIAMAVSRRFEREADFYCLRAIRDPVALSRAMKRLAKDNLSNLRPHPVYVWFNYSHPPLLDRIRYIEAFKEAER